MKSLEQLQHLHFLNEMNIGNSSDCINWAIERLQLDEDNGDVDVILLAAATESDEVSPLVDKIVKKYADVPLDKQVAAGKYIVLLYEAYKAGEESVISLDNKIVKLYSGLDYPDWLVMLSRNCEYATDMPAYLTPFQDEFEYIAVLWANSETRADFESSYSRNVSREHDAKLEKVDDSKT